MPMIQSGCCWRSLRVLCYALAFYAMASFSVTIVNTEYLYDVHERYLNGKIKETESENFSEPDKITPIAVSLRITLLTCSSFGFVACVVLIIGVYKDMKYLLLLWIVVMLLEILVKIINFVFPLYLQTVNFNPKTSILFTLDFFTTALKIYAMIYVISQFQEFLKGRGTAAFHYSDRSRHFAQRISNREISPQSNTPPLPDIPPPPALPQVVATDPPETPHRVVVIANNSQRPPQRLLVVYEVFSSIALEARVKSSLWMELKSEAPSPKR